MAKISHHGSCRSKCSTEFKCICFENGNRWNGELDNVKPMKSGRVFIEVETKQQFKNLLKATKLLSYLPKNIKICHQMRGTGQDGRRRNQKLTSATRNHCCQKNLHKIHSLHNNHQRTNNSKNDQYWMPEKKTRLYIPTLKDVFNARNLDTPRIHVKVKLFVLDVVKKDTI